MSNAPAPSQVSAGLFRRMLRPLIGDIQWQAPRWIGSLASAIGFCAAALTRWVRADKRRAAIAAGVGVALLAGGMAGKVWYDKQPKPLEVTLTLTAPEPTAVDQPNAKPEPLVIKFSDSVATLAGVGKDVTTGITLEPRIDGTWKWDDDRTLTLNPKADWPVGTEVVVSLAKKGLFTEQIRLKDYQAKFSMQRSWQKLPKRSFIRIRWMWRRKELLPR